MMFAKKYKYNWRKRLRKHRSEAATKGWETRRLREQGKRCDSDNATRARIDRKGDLFDIWKKSSGAAVEIYHSVDGRTDQYDVFIHTAHQWNDGFDTEYIPKISMPNLLKEWVKIN